MSERRWKTLQRAWRKHSGAWRTHDTAMRVRYRTNEWPTWCTDDERKTGRLLETRHARAQHAVYAWLAKNSPRDWTEVPANYVCDTLTYEEATTAGPLTTLPPLAYGQSTRERRLFMAAVKEN